MDEEDEDTEDGADDSSKKKKKRLQAPFVIRMLKFNAPEWPWILLGAICSIAYGAIQPLFALFFAQIYRLFAEPDLEEQKRLTSVYAAAIFLIGFGGGLAQFFSTLGFAKSGEALTMRMRQLTFAAMLRQEIGYFDYESNSVGALVTRLSSDASALKVRRGELTSTGPNLFSFLGLNRSPHWHHSPGDQCDGHRSSNRVPIRMETDLDRALFYSIDDVHWCYSRSKARESRPKERQRLLS